MPLPKRKGKKKKAIEFEEIVEDTCEDEERDDKGIVAPHMMRKRRIMMILTTETIKINHWCS